MIAKQDFNKAAQKARADFLTVLPKMILWPLKLFIDGNISVMLFQSSGE